MKKTNIKLKVLFTLSILFMFAIALAPNINAVLACDWDIIGGFEDNETLMLDELINVSFSGAGVTDDLITIYVNASSSSTANSSVATFLLSADNNSGNPGTGIGHVNFTFPDLGELSLEDSSDYVFECACQGSASARVDCGTAVTGITIDRTKPQAPTSLSPTGTQTKNDLTFTATVNGANTTSCNLIFTSALNPGSTIYTMTNSGDTCTKTITSIQNEAFTFIIEATDGTNKTNASSAVDFKIETGGGSSGGSAPGIAISEKAKTIGEEIQDAVGVRKGAIKRITEAFRTFVQNIVDGIKSMFGR